MGRSSITALVTLALAAIIGGVFGLIPACVFVLGVVMGIALCASVFPLINKDNQP